MPLTFARRDNEDFFIENEQYVMLKIEGREVRVKHTKSHKIFTLSAERSTEVCEDVFVSIGAITQPGTARLSFEAPREINIVRGERYRTGVPA